MFSKWKRLLSLRFGDDFGDSEISKEAKITNDHTDS